MSSLWAFVSGIGEVEGDEELSDAAVKCIARGVNLAERYDLADEVTVRFSSSKPPKKAYAIAAQYMMERFGNVGYAFNIEDSGFVIRFSMRSSL